MNASKQVQLVSLLIEAKADVNVRDQSGSTALMNAAWFGCTDAAKLLLSHGADPAIRDLKNRSALKLAVETNHVAIQKLLEAHQARPV